MVFTCISFLAMELFLQTKLSIVGRNYIHMCVCVFLRHCFIEAGKRALPSQHPSLIPSLEVMVSIELGWKMVLDT